MKCPICDNHMKKGTSCQCGEFSHVVVGNPHAELEFYALLFMFTLGFLVSLMFLADYIVYLSNKVS